MTTTHRRPFPLFALVLVLIIWSVLAYAFVFVFAGGHVCTLLQTIPPGGGPIPPMTDAEMAAKTAACNRPDIGAIAWSGVGYIVIAVVAIRMFRRSRVPDPDIR